MDGLAYKIALTQNTFLCKSNENIHPYKQDFQWHYSCNGIYYTRHTFLVGRKNIEQLLYGALIFEAFHLQRKMRADREKIL